MSEPFGWAEAIALVGTPRPKGEHRPWLGCECLDCQRIRLRVQRYGFTREGLIGTKRPAVQPWEEAA